jgi:hypothetical protein
VTGPTILLLLLGAGNLANGLWMLFDAAGWYEAIARDTGPLNVHFVRDIGAAYAAAGAALAWGAFAPAARGALAAVAAVFLGIHALTHLLELLGGHSHGLPALELFGVHLPALLVVILAALALRRPAEA